MRSTLGRRAEICKELGWSLDFVEHGISYVKLQMMMLDLPRVVKAEDGANEGGYDEIELTEDNVEDVFGTIYRGMGGK